LVVGFPAFGHTFTLQSETENGIGADSIGVGDAGPWTQAAGTLSYNEVQVCCCVVVAAAGEKKIIFLCAADEVINPNKTNPLPLVLARRLWRISTRGPWRGIR